MEVRGTFAAVRPYGEGIRVRVFSFLASMQLDLADGQIVEPGTPDDEAARMIDGFDADLLLLPFHLHRDRDGRAVDGVGVALQLSPAFMRRRVPILMPVSGFSEGASFPRRLDELTQTRPDVIRTLVPMPESQIGDAEIRARIASMLR
jgi:hypothetical protein